MSVRPHGINRPPLDEFHEMLYLRAFRISVEKIQVSLKSDRNNGHFTRRRIFIYDNIPLSSSKNEKYFSQNYRENQNTYFTFSNSFPKMASFMR